ncbi:unnamed protein product [Vitrella brassicaformis CCMP3155]|uniref:Importin subunit alpha n=1 Tax=Vitrella brassicaformis (strain CCMP3155) TaxID=1169540 RepID=A0A0G4GHQ2_VITBC|nr:unnamed protein product [Vitrella brassicaformis CCMP3155]|eukprot:CEM29160.1 unnamed protein product [Vitrella brassicaformis CCMP3155]
MRGVSAFFSAVWVAVCSLIWPDLKQLTVPQLAKRLSSRFSFIKIRLSALRELHRRVKENRHAATDAIHALPVLVRLLKSCQPMIVREAARCLAAIAIIAADDLDAAAAMSALRQQLSSPHLDVRVHAASALCRIATSRQRVGVNMACLLGVISDGLKSGDAAIQLEAAAAVRKLVAIEGVPPIQEAIDAGVVQPLVGLLSDSSMPKVQFEAAWALTNIAGGTSEQTQAVVEAGGIPPLIQLLSSDGDARDQAMWALGNIASDGPLSRDLVLAAGVIKPLVDLLRESKKVSIVRSATWTLWKLCRGRPQPLFELVSPAVPVVAELIKTPQQDAEVLIGACWALSYVTHGRADEDIEAVVGSGVCGRLVQLMGHDSREIQLSTVSTVGNIVAGNDVQTQAMIEWGAIPALQGLLSSPVVRIRRQACWTISNIMAGSREQRQAVIDGDVVPQVITTATTDEPNVRREALWAIINGVFGRITAAGGVFGCEWLRRAAV